MEIENFIDACATVMICEHRQKRWKANWPHIAAVGESIGITKPELDPGGKYYDEIMSRLGTLNLNTIDGGRKDAKATAEVLFGPAGEMASDFMVKRFIF